jgi:hypothetical protein
MIKDDQAGKEAQVAIRNIQIVDGSAGQAGLNELFEVISPVAKAAAQRKWEVCFFE